MTRPAGSIDIESHYVPAVLLEGYRNAPPGSNGAALIARAAAQAANPTDANRRFAMISELEPRIAEMDEAGVELTLLSVAALPDYPADAECEQQVADLISACNDALLAAAATYPGRFAVMASLPFPYADRCVAELERLDGEELVKAVIAHAATDNYTLEIDALEPVYRAVAGAGLPLFLHPAGQSIQRQPMFDRWTLNGSIAAMVETTTAAARLMLSGMLDRVADLVLIVPHLGGTMPYLVGRFGDQSGSGDAEHDVAFYLEHRVRLGTCSFHQPALQCAAATVGADKIILATDFPYRGTLMRSVDHILESSLSREDQLAILSGNATRLGFCVGESEPAGAHAQQ
jgi:predicted TIM-barrel fold metal-dependent hydrolase